MNQPNSPLINFKSRIEEMFTDIKKTTHSSDTPHLSLHQKRWMEQLTDDLVNAITQFNNEQMLGETVQGVVNSIGQMRSYN